MQESLMAGIWRFMLSLPPALWQSEVERTRKKASRALAGSHPETRRVHHHVVARMPAFGAPIPPEAVADELGLASRLTVEILDGLEKRLTFLWRNDQGHITWAYPVTVEKTPHAIALDTGESLYAA
ncbi:MAG: hypothetical protein AB1921_01185 [Thermodesulfobacteriota bacterium]